MKTKKNDTNPRAKVEDITQRLAAAKEVHEAASKRYADTCRGTEHDTAKQLVQTVANIAVLEAGAIIDNLERKLRVALDVAELHEANALAIATSPARLHADLETALAEIAAAERVLAERRDAFDARMQQAIAAQSKRGDDRAAAGLPAPHPLPTFHNLSEFMAALKELAENGIPEVKENGRLAAAREREIELRVQLEERRLREEASKKHNSIRQQAEAEERADRARKDREAKAAEDKANEQAAIRRRELAEAHRLREQGAA